MPVDLKLSEQSKPIKLWARPEEIEPQALQQLHNTASLPFVFKHVAVMPDVHVGIGATVGSVVATQGAIIPAAVGVDIGCGMMAVKTTLPADQIIDNIRGIRSQIEAQVPLGFQSNKSMNTTTQKWPGWKKLEQLTYIDKDLAQKAKLQLGTLGGGNHFIEICLDKESAVWVLLHSGSRHIGKSLAERHIHSAKRLMREKLIRLPDPNLAYFLHSSEEFKRYYFDVDWCQSYAFENRQEIMRRILKILNAQFTLTVNCHHNYVSEETHFGERVFVTRKGAVRAQVGDLGIIPGSMGARSFIVRGLGNPESFHSCSHGAGRRFSRTEAKKRFNTRDLVAQTQGVECRKDSGVVDEIPSAYKNIDEVMAHQRDLVEIVAELKQIMCVKG